MTRSRSRSRFRTGARSDSSHSSAPSAIDSQRRSRSSSRMREPAGFIVLKVSMGAYIAPRSVYLRNDPSTTILDVKEKIYDEIERITLKHRQLFFLIQRESLASNHEYLLSSHLISGNLCRFMASQMVPKSDARSGARSVARRFVTVEKNLSGGMFCIVAAG